ncbi:hypothetical protein CJ030_MR4G022377 [Morella rubra]|uniref:Uncharacterized protein n=1 Tax=Morella rubra TaxID=262757 RepID=A0A6A1VRE7_9ROSI|nr:hypothetical protein CJ030_MR4G022377 [Morella rubra]
MDWSVRVKTYLVALDLWNIVEATTGPPKYEDDEAGFMAWNKKDSFALQVIQNSCEPDIFAEIQEISSAKIAWKTLSEKYNTTVTTDAGLSTETYNTTTTTDTGSCVGTYAALYKAVRSGDWDAVNEFLQDRPNAVRAQITTLGDTALHIAVDNGRHVSIVERLVDLMQEEDIEIRDNFGDTALAGAAVHGKFRMAECMVSKNMKLLTIGNSDGDLPVTSAISVGQIKMARYLYSLTPPEYLMPERGDNGGKVFVEAIYTGTLGKNSSPFNYPVLRAVISTI